MAQKRAWVPDTPVWRKQARPRFITSPGQFTYSYGHVSYAENQADSSPRYPRHPAMLDFSCQSDSWKMSHGAAIQKFHFK